MVRAALLSASCFLFSAVVPTIGAVVMLLAPSPILIYAVGRPDPNRRTTATVLIAAVCVAILWSPLVSLNYFFSFGLPAMIMCLMIERRRPFELIVASAGSAMFIAMVCAGLIARSGTFGVARTIYHDLTKEPFFLGWLMRVMVSGPELYRHFRIETPLTAETQAAIVRLVIRLSPALVLLAAAFSVLLNLRVFWRFAGSRRLNYKLFGDLMRWSAPEWLVWPLVSAGFAWWLIPLARVREIALNGLLVTAAIYFCQGLAIVAFYLQTLAVPTIARAIIYLIVFVQPVVAMIICVAGIFDLWIDFRRIRPPSQQAPSLGKRLL